MALTIEEIKAQGNTILTDPSQTKDFDVKGQFGETGAEGSFLYGTAKPVAPATTTTPTTPTTNKDGLTIEQANDPKYWKDGKYIGVDQTITPEDTPDLDTKDTIDDTTDETETGELDDEAQRIEDEIAAGLALGSSHTKTLENAWADSQDLDEEYNAITARITANYKQRFDSLDLVNKGIKGNTFTAGLVSGRARYASKIAEGNLGAAETAAQGRVSALTSDMNQEIALAKQAAKTGAKSDYLALANHLKNIEDIQADRITAAKDALNLSMTIDTWGKEQATWDREEMELSAERVASSLYSIMGDDVSETTKMALMQDAAKEYDMPIDYLMSAYNTYSQENEEYLVNTATKLINMEGKINKGETIEIAPGVIVTGTKEADEFTVAGVSGTKKFNDIWRKNKDGVYENVQRIDAGDAKGTGSDLPGEVSSEIDTLAKAYIRGETLGSIGATKKAQVLARVEELKIEQAGINRPKTVDAVNQLIQTAREDGYDDNEIIQGFVEDFGFTKESATRMIKPLI